MMDDFKVYAPIEGHLIPHRIANLGKLKPEVNTILGIEEWNVGAFGKSNGSQNKKVMSPYYDEYITVRFDWYWSFQTEAGWW